MLVSLFSSLVVSNKNFEFLFTNKLMRDKVLHQQAQESVLQFLFEVQKEQDLKLSEDSKTPSSLFVLYV